jgi:hypothetical protein
LFFEGIFEEMYDDEVAKARAKLEEPSENDDEGGAHDDGSGTNGKEPSENDDEGGAHDDGSGTNGNMKVGYEPFFMTRIYVASEASLMYVLKI